MPQVLPTLRLPYATMPHISLLCAICITSFPEDRLIWIAVPGRDKGKSRGKKKSLSFQVYSLDTQEWLGNDDVSSTFRCGEESMVHPAVFETVLLLIISKDCELRNSAGWKICFPSEQLCSKHSTTLSVEKSHGILAKSCSKDQALPGFVQECS